MKIIFCYADSPREWNSSYYRSYLPAAEIERISPLEGIQARLMPLQQFARPDEENLKLLEGADVIVVERNFFGGVLGAMETWKRAGKLIVADFDDAYNLMTQDNPAYPFWVMGISEAGPLQFHPLAQFMTGLTIAGLVTPASLALQEDFAASNPKMRFIPNYPSMRELPPAHRHKDFVRIGWGGSGTHYQSFVLSGILPALARILKESKFTHVSMELSGDRRVYDRLVKDLGVNPLRINFKPWDVDRAAWLERQSNFDLGIIPLATMYDMRRSSIKALELMGMGVPVVASRMSGLGPYDMFDKSVVLTENGVTAWYTTLMAAIDNIDQLRREADTVGIETARRNSIETRLPERIKIYKEAM